MSETETQLEHKMEKVPVKPPTREEVLSEALDKFDSMIGLSEIKSEINGLLMEIKGRQKMELLGKIQQKHPMRHMMFTGAAGTGKTEVARLISAIFYGTGFIKENKVIEVDRSTIVGQFIGQTEANTKEIIEKAKGGILFIDEAYSLAGDDNDFGREAITILIKAMEDHRDELIIILVGYQADMKRLLKMNDGFDSRIPYKFHFPDYTPEELTRIIARLLKDRGFDCIGVLKEIKSAVAKVGKKGSIEGNGRWARTMVDRMIKYHHIRIGQQIDDANIGEIILEDVTQAIGGSRSVAPDRMKVDGLMQIRNEALEELDNMVGLDDLKKETKRIMNFIGMEKKREEMGLQVEPVGMHMVFAGPPGTGKTTVARIIGKFLYGIGFLSASTFIEADRSTIVGKYIGHTEENMMNLLDKADGGVLFIDEAYALAGKGGNDFGEQAVNILIKAMEERRENLVVILAGYEHEMEALLATNSGFQSRIPYRLHFPEYKAVELIEITRRKLGNLSLLLSPKADLYLEKWVKVADETGRIHGSARWTRNLVDQIRLEQSNRLTETGCLDFLGITEADIQQASRRMI